MLDLIFKFFNQNAEFRITYPIELNFYVTTQKIILQLLNDSNYLRGIRSGLHKLVYVPLMHKLSVPLAIIE